MSETTNDILAKIQEQYNKNKPKEKKQKFTDEERKNFLKKYYNIITEGEHVFRLLPPLEGQGTPFVETYFHHLKVNGKWTKLYCPSKNDGNTCPLCQAEEALKSTGDQDDFTLSRTYQASLFYIVKGIDRNKPDDGVKFWRFKHNYKQQGIFDKIMPVFARKGEIFDPISGRDLLITASETTAQNGKTYIGVSAVMYDEESRLVDNDDTLKSLVDDTTSWKEVYKPKPTEYLQQVVEGKAPYWDENTRTMVTPQGHGKKILKVEETTETTTETTTDSIDEQLTKKTSDVFDSSEVKTPTPVVEEESDDLPF